MKILFLGDVMGRSGRDAIAQRLPGLRADWKLDFVVVNGENAASGAGLTGKIAGDLFAAGADVVTLGDHAFDQRDMIAHITTEPRLIRPLNFAKAAPGAGVRLFEAPRGRRVLVAQALGRVFMSRPYDDPFSALDAALKTAPLAMAFRPPMPGPMRSSSTSTPRRRPRRWGWATGWTAAPASSSAPIPMCPPATR